MTRDGPTDGQTDTPSYRDARTHLKIDARMRMGENAAENNETL